MMDLSSVKAFVSGGWDGNNVNPGSEGGSSGGPGKSPLIGFPSPLFGATLQKPLPQDVFEEGMGV